MLANFSKAFVRTASLAKALLLQAKLCSRLLTNHLLTKAKLL